MGHFVLVWVVFFIVRVNVFVCAKEHRYTQAKRKGVRKRRKDSGYPVKKERESIKKKKREEERRE